MAFSGWALKSRSFAALRMTILEEVLRQRLAALAAVGAALGVERDAVLAAVIHLAREPLGEKPCPAEDQQHQREAFERFFQARQA